MVTSKTITLLNVILTNLSQQIRLVTPSTDINTFHLTLKKTQLVKMSVRTSLPQTITTQELFYALLTSVFTN